MALPKALRDALQNSKKRLRSTKKMPTQEQVSDVSQKMASAFKRRAARAGAKDAARVSASDFFTGAGGNASKVTAADFFTGAAEAGSVAGAGGQKGILAQLMAKYPKAGPLAAGIVPGLLLSKLFSTAGNAMSMSQEAKLAEAQLAGVTPEGLFYQAALPAQRAEEMALKQALVSRLTGGVLGPVGVPGETIIGG